MKKIAIPITNGILSSHFGHCEQFAVYSLEDGNIVEKVFLQPPAHEPGSHPNFLKTNGCDTIIAGGMGMKAQTLFNQYGIEVIVGAELSNPDDIITACTQGNLQAGENRCDH